MSESILDYFGDESPDVKDVIGGQEKQIKKLQAENKMLREGMKGDYDLDRWLDWALEAEQILADKAELIKTLEAIKREYTPNGNLARDINEALAKHKGEG